MLARASELAPGNARVAALEREIQARAPAERE
jgi:hypothetical protein